MTGHSDIWDEGLTIPTTPTGKETLHLSTYQLSLVLDAFKADDGMNIVIASGMDPDSFTREELIAIKNEVDDLNDTGDEERTVMSHVATYTVAQMEDEKIRAHWIDNHNGTISCSSCHTWFYKDDRYSYMHYCPCCNEKIAHQL